MASPIPQHKPIRRARSFFLSLSAGACLLVQSACEPAECPTIQPCHGNKEAGLVVYLDLSKLHPVMPSEDYQLRVESNDEAPVTLYCRVDAPCLDEPITYTEETTPKPIDPSAYRHWTSAEPGDGNKVLRLAMGRNRGGKDTWGPASCKITLTSGELKRELELSPRYEVIRDTQCAKCRAFGHRWIPVP